jgi:hypothetical protein
MLHTVIDQATAREIERFLPTSDALWHGSSDYGNPFQTFLVPSLKETYRVPPHPFTRCGDVDCPDGAANDRWFSPEFF